MQSRKSRATLKTFEYTILLTGNAKAEATDFQHFCVSLYEQTAMIFTKQERADDIEHLNRE
jgi:hypothetical protein